jgi:hypothetical protein
VSNDIKDEIVSAIAKTNDDNMKVVLLLLLTVVSEIGDKIEKMRTDEQGLRAVVLNGHEPVHHTHHEWITRKIKEEEDEAKADKDSRRKIRDGLIERGLWSALVLFLLIYGVVLK